MSAPLWLVGAGDMAIAYARVLAALKAPFQVVGRGEASGKAFHQALSVPVATGGVESALGKGRPESAIVAVGLDQLAGVAKSLLRAGVPRILVEKPAGLGRAEIESVAALAREKGVQVFVGYNRRFYASVLAAEAMIEADGGLLSMSFDFTEWSHLVGPSRQAPGAKENWVLANSSHVIDLAFFLGGSPTTLRAERAGALDWHPAAARFSGSGKTAKGALFSYQADWEAPGRWGLDLRTRERRLVLQPLESLSIQTKGSTALEPAALDAKLDADFKPGLHRQTQAFLQGKDGRLKTIAEQAQFAASVIGPILGRA